MTLNPKDGPVWRSTKYRRFIRDHQICFICGCELLDEPPTYESHHHAHAGGQRPRDQLLVPLCRRDHSAFHCNESAFNKKHLLTEDKWLQCCIMSLEDYVESLNINAKWVQINALAQVAMENE